MVTAQDLDRREFVIVRFSIYTLARRFPSATREAGSVAELSQMRTTWTSRCAATGRDIRGHPRGCTINAAPGSANRSCSALTDLETIQPARACPAPILLN